MHPTLVIFYLENLARILPIGSKTPCTISIEVTIIREIEVKLFHMLMASIKQDNRALKIHPSWVRVEGYGGNHQWPKK